MLTKIGLVSKNGYQHYIPTILADNSNSLKESNVVVVGAVTVEGSVDRFLFTHSIHLARYAQTWLH